MARILIVDDSPMDRKLVEGILSKQQGVVLHTAENGQDALARLQDLDGGIDAVVTDLTMPDMDGLELMTRLQVHYADIPVVLTTANGSEDLAVKALESGAASYVPKSRLATHLVPAVQQVLELVDDDQTYRDLSASMEEARFTFCLDNDKSVFVSLAELVKQIIAGRKLCSPSDQVRLCIAIEEALLLMSYRGNLELTNTQMYDAEVGDAAVHQLITERTRSQPFRDRRLYVDVCISGGGTTLDIQHDNPAFDPASLLNSDAPEIIYDPANRGIVILKTVMNRIVIDSEQRKTRFIKHHGATQATEA